MDQSTPKISGTLKGAAFGATIAMLPFAFILLLSVLEIFKGGSESLAKTLTIIQFIGCFIWIGCIIGTFTNAKKLNISTGGLVSCIIGILIGGILQFIAVIEPKLIFGVLNFGRGDLDASGLFLLFTLAANLPLAIGTLIVGKSLRALRVSAIGYFFLSVFPLILVLIYELFKTKSYGYYGYSYDTHTAIIIAVILLFMLALLCVSGWWRSSSNAYDIEYEYQNGIGDFAPQPMLYVEPQYTTAQQVSAKQPVIQQPMSQQPGPPPAQTGSALTDAQRNLLMGMSDQELNNVVNNPSLYTNKAFVDEAAKILNKRQAWEMIKDYSDEQLLSIVHDNIQDFSYEVLDAASMELFSREAPAFVNEINALETAELQGIVNNPNAYYDGYVRAATLVLSNRQNNQPQA